MNGYGVSARARAHGASLVELLAVAAIAAILAALALPPALLALRASREGRAIASLKSVVGAEMIHYGSTRRFAAFDELFRARDLGGQFERGAEGGGPLGAASEAISDGVYLYSIRFADDSRGVTIDADPRPRFAATYRRFRFRIGRTAANVSGSESVLLVAAPSDRSPPASAYAPLGAGR
jgi:hypothetical protein